MCRRFWRDEINNSAVGLRIYRWLAKKKKRNTINSRLVYVAFVKRMQYYSKIKLTLVNLAPMDFVVELMVMGLLDVDYVLP